MIPSVHQSNGRALGDVWSSLNYFMSLNVNCHVNLWYEKHGKKRYAYNLMEILPLLQDNQRIKLIDLNFEQKDMLLPKPNWKIAGATKIHPTTVRWLPNDSKTICYQLDGIARKEKNCSKEDEEKLLNTLQGRGFHLQRVGKPLTLQICVDLLSQSKCFIGVDSGLGHVAAAVGIPVYYIQNQRHIAAWSIGHANKQYTLASNVDHLLTMECFK